MIPKDEFVCGFACAVSNLIRMNGCETPAEELFRAGLKYDLKWLRKCGVDEMDIEVFKKHRQQLKRR